MVLSQIVLTSLTIKNDVRVSLGNLKTLEQHRVVMEMIVIKTVNRYKEIIKSITTSWLLRAKEGLIKAISKPKAMRISLEFHLG